MQALIAILLSFSIAGGSLSESSSIGKLQPRHTKEVKQVLHVDSSCLDRDYADFDSYKSYLDSLGCRRMRIIAGWAKCEAVKGQYNFGWLDNVVDYCLAKGIEPWFLLAYGNPVYEGGGTKFLGGGMPVSEEAIKAWDNWVRALSQHFKGRVRSWEIWNEPEHFICLKPKDLVNRHPGHLEIYTALCERTATILRNADRNCEIAFGALAYVEPLLLKDILDIFKANKTLKLFDFVTVHGYPQRPEDNHPKEMAVEELVKKYSRHIKVWSGESGAPSSGKTGGSLSRRDWNEATQGKWDIRRMIGDHAHGYRTGVFTIADINYAKTDQIKKKNLKGLLETDENKQVVKAKEAYFAVRNLMCVIDLLDKPLKADRIGIEGLDASFSKYVFADKESGKKSILLWEDAILPQKASVYHKVKVNTGGIKFKNPVAVDIRTGLVYALEQKGAEIEVPVYDSPVMITEKNLISFK